MEKVFNSKLLVIIIASLLIAGAIIWACIAYFNNPLSQIYIKSLPAKTDYYEYENFDATGMEVVAKYKNYNKEKIIENFSIIVDSPLTTETDKATISYTESGITKTTTVDINVKPRLISEMVIVNQPYKTEYFVGEFFDLKGLKLQVNCEDDAKPFEPKNIKISKENIPLTTSDQSIEIAYTENSRTVFASVPIVVKEITSEEQEVQVVKDLIGFLPDIDNATIEDENTIEYVKNSFDKLSQQQKEEIGADEILEELTSKIEELKKEQETILNKSYSITYIPKLETMDFVANNSSVYKNAQGVVTLNNPISTELFNKGYDFSHWEDKKGDKVTQLQNITEDTTFYAVFELSNIINLLFTDKTDNSEIGVMQIQRYNGTNFQYNLINNEVNNFIFNVSNKIPTKFYINETSLTTISTSQGRVLEVLVELSSLDSLIQENLPQQERNCAIFVFGDNVKEFPLSNGYLEQSAISDIYAYYNEQNDIYLNYYLIDEEKKVYSELENINFNNLNSNVVVVTKVENNFSLTIDSGDNKKTFNGLKGKQTIQDALIEYADNDESILNLISGLEEKFDLKQMLNQNIVLSMQDRTAFNIILHNESETTTISVPDATVKNYKLTENLPELQKLGYIFSGWALKDGENALTDEYINIIMQNKNKNSELFAIWEINPNYDFPETSVNYNNDFVGEWEAKVNHDGKILEINLNLNADGVYKYTVNCNGLINSTIVGEYRYEENEIVIYSLALDGDYQLIKKSDLSFDFEYLDSNILVGSCFYITKYNSATQVEKFDVVLNKGNIKFANYYGEDFLGKYQFVEKDILTNVIKTYTIDLLNNGYANLTVDEKTINVIYRVVDNKIIILSNDVFKVKDITNFINDSNRV